MSDLRFWRRIMRLAVLVNVAVWLAIILIVTGCAVWPWQKPPTYDCRLYVPNAQNDPQQHIFNAFRHWAHYLDPRTNGSDHVIWYGAPDYPHEVVVAFSKYRESSMWNVWPCP